ncbi:MAG: dockerin type I repeat-containing protein [Oscillospiraceae bacterium]|nr:dockerin type I repeat-containing protein [Oscillospiraceae bacterium]
MKQMRHRLLSLIMMAAIAVGLLSTAAFADEGEALSPTISAQDGSMAADGTVTLNVTLSNLDAQVIKGLTLGVVCDDALELTDIDLSTGLCAGGYISSSASTGILNFVSTGDGIRSDGVLATVTLRAKDSTQIASGTYGVAVVMPENGIIIDANYADVADQFTFATGWVTVNAAATGGYSVTVTDGTKGGATISLTEGSYGGAVTFTVANSAACVVAYSTDGGVSYTRLTATAADDSGGYSFTVEVSQGMDVAVVRKGDVNGDGNISSADYTRANAAHRGDITLSALQFLAADLDGDGTVSTAEAAQIGAVFAGKLSLSW